MWECATIAFYAQIRTCAPHRAVPEYTVPGPNNEFDLTKFFFSKNERMGILQNILFKFSSKPNTKIWT